MIELTTALRSPMEIEIDEDFVVGSETACPENWSGQYISPSQPTRAFRLRWEEASEADAAAFRVLLGRIDQDPTVVYTPPTGQTTPRAAVSSTIVGRLVGPFSLRQRGYNRYRLEARIEEDL